MRSGNFKGRSTPPTIFEADAGSDLRALIRRMSIENRSEERPNIVAMDFFVVPDVRRFLQPIKCG